LNEEWNNCGAMDIAWNVRGFAIGRYSEVIRGLCGYTRSVNEE
jgi:hypothetical protein